MNTLLTESKTHKIFQSIPTVLYAWRVPLLGTWIPGLLAYMFAFTNKLVNHDDAFYLFGKGATVESGRWGLSFLSLIFPDVSMPWIYGVITLALLSVSICICIRLLSIRNKLLQFLLAGITVTFPSQIATFAYMFTASSYAVALLLAVLAAYLLTLDRKSLWLPALLCAILFCSIYQAYIAVTSTLLVLHLVNLLLRTDTPEKKVLTRGIAYVAFLALTLGIYWVVTNCIWSFNGIGAGLLAQGALSSSLPGILSRIRTAYLMFREILFLGELQLVATPFSNLIHFLVLFLSGLEFVVWVLHNKKWPRILFLLFLLAILPLSICCMYLFVHPLTVHSLVVYGFVFLYYLVAILLEAGQLIPTAIESLHKYRRFYYDVIQIGLALIITCNTYIANAAYLNLYLQYQNTYSLTTSMAAALQDMPGFTEDSKVAIASRDPFPAYWSENDYCPLYLTGITGIILGDYAIGSMVEYYNGFALNIVSEEEMERIMETDAFRDMPVYPSYGSIQKINDVFVVKFSDNSK